MESSNSCHLGSEKSGKKTSKQKHMKATTEAALSSGSFELGQEEVSLLFIQHRGPQNGW